MLHRLFSKSSGLSTAAMLLGMLVVSAGSTPAYGDSAQVSKLLQDAKTSSAQLMRDTSQMETYSRSKVTWQSHASQIDRVKEHINNTGKILADLHSARDGAEPWQQDAIDKITPLAQILASNTTNIINRLNDDKTTWSPEFQGYLKSNADVASDLSKLISDYLDYESAASKTQGLSQKLGFPGY
jgi:hypothetical protein